MCIRDSLYAWAWALSCIVAAWWGRLALDIRSTHWGTLSSLVRQPCAFGHPFGCGPVCPLRPAGGRFFGVASAAGVLA
eukprot:1820113-Alexandrium_andersonii.AAC.1